MDCTKGTPREILPGPMRRLLYLSVLPAGCCLSCAAGGMMMGGGGVGPPQGAAEGAAIERQCIAFQWQHPHMSGERTAREIFRVSPLLSTSPALPWLSIML